MLRRREWVRVYDGVYVNHTGALTWQQRAWAAVLLASPAALCHDSAIRVGDGKERRDRPDESPIHIAVDRRRSVVAPRGVVAHQLADLDNKAQWNLSPPRQRIEHAIGRVSQLHGLLRAAPRAPRRVLVSRRCWRIASLLRLARHSAGRRSRRPRVRRHALLDVAAVAANEHGYLTRVERPHGLPRASRQVSAGARGRIYRDVEYDEFAVVVELDGRQFHDNAIARDDDLDRDLDAAVERKVTLRLGWGQVFARPCLTAARVGEVLQQHGWTGVVVACPLCPEP